MEDPSPARDPPTGKDQAKWSSSSGCLGLESRGSVWATGSYMMVSLLPKALPVPLQVPESSSLGPGCVAQGTPMAPDWRCQATGKIWTGHANSAYPSPGRCW